MGSESWAAWVMEWWRQEVSIYPGGVEEHVCAGGGMREEVGLRVCLEKGSTKSKSSKGRAKKEKEGGDKRPFADFLLWTRGSLDGISFYFLNPPILQLRALNLMGTKYLDKDPQLAGGDTRIRRRGYMLIPLSQFIPPPFPSWCPHVCSLCLCLYSCFANKFPYTIFSLDSIYICIDIRCLFFSFWLISLSWQSLGPSTSLRMAQACSI